MHFLGISSPHASILVSGVSFLASVACFYALAWGKALVENGAKHPTDSPKEVTIRTAMYALWPVHWVLSYSGLTECTSLLLMFAALLTATRKHYLLTGLLCGLNILNRTPMVAVLGTFLLLHRRGALPLLLGSMIPLMPWWIRNYSLTGDPLFSFSTARNLYLGIRDIELDLIPVPVPWGEVVWKWLENIASPWWLLTACIIILAFEHRACYLARFMGFFAALNGLGICTAYHSLRFYVPSMALLPLFLPVDKIPLPRLS